MRKYSGLIDLMELPDIFRKREDLSPRTLTALVSRDDSNIADLEDETWKIASVQYGFTVDDIAQIETLNRKMNVYHSIADALDMDLYVSSLSLPYQIGAMRKSNRAAHQLYETVKKTSPSEVGAMLKRQNLCGSLSLL